MRVNLAMLAVLCTALVAACGSGDKPEAAPRVTLTTDRGEIVIELYTEKAPVTTANFLAYVEAGHYDEGEIYRVVRFDNDRGDPKINVIQGGLNLDQAAPLPSIEHETTNKTAILHTDGVISMARLEPGSAASEFFISIGDNPGLDYGGMRNPDKQGFAAFGRVIQGMDVVREIHALTQTVPADDPYFEGQILAEPVKFRAVIK
ncbi:MAG: peptidylprolyl isomerase [Aquisalinus sp.]|nr:peptidylprolyl isomerase [Aquisalinus sp.]